MAASLGVRLYMYLKTCVRTKSNVTVNRNREVVTQHNEFITAHVIIDKKIAYTNMRADCLLADCSTRGMLN